MKARGVAQGGRPRQAPLADGRHRGTCRCRECSRAGKNNPVPTHGTDLLAVTCWCEESVVGVPRADVLNGRTGSCGQPYCHEGRAA